MPTSRFDFRKYVSELRNTKSDRKQEYDSFHSTMSGAEKDKLVTRSHRSFWTLFREFWKLLSGHHRQIALGLITLTVSTLLSLLPPLGTKFAIDFALTDPPKSPPEWAPVWIRENSGMRLLIGIAVAVTLVTLVRTAIHLWGRWQCTKAVNQVQTSIRKKVFEHMLEMPLNRVQLLKSGGSASLLHRRFDFQHALQPLASHHSIAGKLGYFDLGGLAFDGWRRVTITCGLFQPSYMVSSDSSLVSRYSQSASSD